MVGLILIMVIIVWVVVIALCKAAGKEGKVICIYNEQVKCYEVPCMYCPVRKECQLVCSSDYNSCEGLKILNRGDADDR